MRWTRGLKIGFEGKRFRLMPIEERYIDAGWLDWLNDPERTRFIETKANYHREDVLEYLNLQDFNTNFMFAIHNRDDGNYIGNARLSSVDYVNRSCKYGRLLSPRCPPGLGIGEEILKMIWWFGFEIVGVDLIHSAANERNVASVVSNLKAGAHIVGFDYWEIPNRGRQPVVKFEIYGREMVYPDQYHLVNPEESS